MKRRTFVKGAVATGLLGTIPLSAQAATEPEMYRGYVIERPTDEQFGNMFNKSPVLEVLPNWVEREDFSINRLIETIESSLLNFGLDYEKRIYVQSIRIPGPRPSISTLYRCVAPLKPYDERWVLANKTPIFKLFRKDSKEKSDLNVRADVLVLRMPGDDLVELTPNRYKESLQLQLQRIC